MEFNPHTRLAGECLQPLGHLSRAGQSKPFRPTIGLAGPGRRPEIHQSPCRESLASTDEPGGVAERLNAAVLKTVDGGNVVRGFESLPLRPHADGLSGRNMHNIVGIAWRLRMSSKERISASIDADLVVAGHKVVDAGRAESRSAWVNRALRAQAERDQRLAALDAFVGGFEADHGEITGAELATAVALRAHGPSLSVAPDKRRSRCSPSVPDPTPRDAATPTGERL
jgi:hypothetical protein